MILGALEPKYFATSSGDHRYLRSELTGSRKFRHWTSLGPMPSDEDGDVDQVDTGRHSAEKNPLQLQVLSGCTLESVDSQVADVAVDLLCKIRYIYIIHMIICMLYLSVICEVEGPAQGC